MPAASWCCPAARPQRKPLACPAAHSKLVQATLSGSAASSGVTFDIASGGLASATTVINGGTETIGAGSRALAKAASFPALRGRARQ